MHDHATIIQLLATYKPITLAKTNIQAAVMVILLLDEKNNIDIVITKRSNDLPTYAGHYSFPGGMQDDTDENLYQTAQREIMEELNIAREDYEYIGQLNDFFDRYGNLVRPFVTLMPKNNFVMQHQMSPHEICELYYFPLTKLQDIKDDPNMHAITRRRPSYTYTDQHVFIWGLTAAILMHFYDVIHEQLIV